ncbi:MAG: hypothetical protein M4579_006363 [Chaenotheca gracillima]|nr:MAG: hypothetical protein M4579_006363 [Chaenotheca gracillima]
MTSDEAFLIQRYVAELEFPTFYELGIQFPLFKTYGIPSMSTLLVMTKELSKPLSATKRIADTVILVTEFLANPPSSERSLKAIARMNYIHGLYEKKGLITQDDLLHTLALFAVEPIRWINRFEWRQLTDMEKCAFGTFWKEIGDAMGIEYEGKLPSAAVDGNSKGSWTDGLHWLEEAAAWAEEYEKQNMVPHLKNKEIADLSVDMVLWNVPVKFKHHGRRVITVLMEERLRKAVMFSPAPPIYRTLIFAFFAIRKFTMRHLALPRPDFLRRHDIHETPDPTSGRYDFRNFTDYPWYVKPTFLRRCGLGAWMTWVLGGTLPGDQGDKFRPQGYEIAELGPVRLEKLGKKEGVIETNRLREKRGGGGCPFGMG